MNSENYMFSDDLLNNALKGIAFMELPENNKPTLSAFSPNAALAMAYVPVQYFNKMYDTEQGFKAGTIFPELDKPFCKGENK